jgi:uncharacterized protein
MYRRKPITDENLRLIPKAAEFLRSRQDVLFAYLFGGLAHGRLKPLSDIDIAVFLSNGNYSAKKMDILGRLTEILQTDEIDLVVLNDAPPALGIRILQNRKILADNAPFERHKYESLTMRKSFDFAIKEQAILKRRFSLG